MGKAVFSSILLLIKILFYFSQLLQTTLIILLTLITSGAWFLQLSPLFDVVVLSSLFSMRLCLSSYSEGATGVNWKWTK